MNFNYCFVKTCPLCGNRLVVDDIEYNFEGNQNEYSTCQKCDYDFIFYIRYGHLWKYDKTKLKSLDNGEFVNDGSTETILVYKRKLIYEKN